MRLDRAVGGWGGRGRHRQPHLRQRRVVPRQHALEHVAEIGEEVPAIRDLDRIGRALPRTVGVGPAPVARHDGHARVGLQPRSGAIGE